MRPCGEPELLILAALMQLVMFVPASYLESQSLGPMPTRLFKPTATIMMHLRPMLKRTMIVYFLWILLIR